MFKKLKKLASWVVDRVTSLFKSDAVEEGRRSRSDIRMRLIRNIDQERLQSMKWAAISEELQMKHWREVAEQMQREEYVAQQREEVELWRDNIKRVDQYYQQGRSL